jgi:hypothetical protein
MAVLAQDGNDPGADQAGPADDDDPHGFPPVSGQATRAGVQKGGQLGLEGVK